MTKKVFAVIQSVDYWRFPNGINPYHVYKTKLEAEEGARKWFSHAPYEIRKVNKSEVPKIKKRKPKMNQEQIFKSLAALMYYQNKPKDAPVISFEKLEEKDRKPFLSLAISVLEQLDQLNLQVVPKTKIKNKEEIETLLKSKIEATIREFFNGIKVWKKELMPQQELTARIYKVWSDL